MIYSVRFTCVLDTNVIYPLYTRDILFWFAHYDLYTIKWSKNIFDEWSEVMKRKGISSSEIKRRLEIANQAFPDALVDNYESLVESIYLPDPKDRHVVAAAIKTNANLIVTNNLKDFPDHYLKQFGLSAKNADDFLTDIIDLNNEIVVKAFKDIISNKKKPELSVSEILSIYRKNNLINTANYLQALV